MSTYCQNTHCHVELLGTLRVVRDGEVLTHFTRQKAARILSYLALYSKQPHPRERLVDLFWPDLDLPAGRDNLSTTLTALRRLLEPRGVPRGTLLLATHQHIGLNAAVVTTDVAEFEGHLSAAGRETGAAKRAERLAQAVALYRGEALAGIYDDWATLESERLQCCFVEALAGWTLALEECGDDEGARRAAIRWVAADPYAEEAHLHLIGLHARTGHSGDAHAAAHRMAHLWQEEFGSALSPASQTNIAALLASEARSVPTEIKSAAPSDNFRVSVPLDCFFGRETELAWLTEWFEAGTSRLVTLVGPGGMGKTRLAQEFARRASARFDCCFVPLAETEDPDQLLPAIVRALALPPDDPAPLAQITAFFGVNAHAGKRRVLLILDNLEQLVSVDDSQASLGQEGESARLIQSLLQAVPHLACLCTSRLSLNLRGERLIPVNPLLLPPEGEDAAEQNADDLSAYASVQLYVDRAKAVRPDFNVTPENAPAVAAVCRLLDGSPLALELAASWVRLLPPRAMWERLARRSGMTALETRRSDVPARHHSLRAALDWSWRLLRPDEQRLLRRLSVFRGGWALEAAEVVCAEPDCLRLLAHLLEASLLRVVEEKDGEARYGLLETVRQYAREQLAESGEESASRARHVEYFLTLVRDAKLEGKEQRHWLDVLEAEHDNLRTALEYCRDDPESGERGLRLAEALLPFWRTRGYLKEGQERILSLLTQPHTSERTAARAAALNCAGILAMLQSDYVQAAACHAEALEIAHACADRLGEANALHGHGNLAFYNQDYPAARTFFQSSLELRSNGDEKGQAASWHSLGSVAMREERYAESSLCYERALQIRRRRGDEIGAAMTLGGLGQMALMREDYAAAARFIKDALRVFDVTRQHWTASLCLNDLGLIAHAQGRLDQETRLDGASQALRGRFNFRIPPAEREAQVARLAALRDQMGETAFETAWAEGQAFSWAQAIAYAQTVSCEEPAVSIAA